MKPILFQEVIMKQKLAVLLALLLSFSLLTGCAAPAETTQPTRAEILLTEPAAETYAAAEIVLVLNLVLDLVLESYLTVVKVLNLLGPLLLLISKISGLSLITSECSSAL